MKNWVALFPGQGSQGVGMGKEFMQHPDTQRFFEEADTVLGEGLSTLMREGPIENLTDTRQAQPALFVVGYAAYHYARQQFGAPAFVAGHSLGEYTALAAAGVFTFAEGVALVRARGEAMAKAYPQGGAMAAVLGAEMAMLEEVTAQAGCVIANDNCPGQVVISGTAHSVERAGQVAKERGAKRVVGLPVSGPFHSPLMSAALPELAQAMDRVKFHNAQIPVVMNVTAQPEQEAFALKQRLLDQLTGRVRWRESVLTLAGLGVTTAYELGVGKVLCGLVNKTSAEIMTHSLTSPEEVARLLAHS